MPGLSDINRFHPKGLAPIHDGSHHLQLQPQQQPPCSLRDSSIGRELTSSNHGLNAHCSTPTTNSVSCFMSQPTSETPTINTTYYVQPAPSPQPPQAYDSQSQPSSSFSEYQPTYGGLCSSSGVVPVKKKNTRVSLACDPCRQLKAKCDETKPCKVCRDRGTECKYRDPPARPAYNTQSRILDGITNMQTQLAALAEYFAQMNERLTRIESLVALKAGPTPKSNAVVDMNTVVDANLESTPFTGVEIAKYYSQDAGAGGPDQEILPEDGLETEPGPPPPLGEPATPMNHTTLAGLLLNWPCIQELTKHHVEREGVRYVGEYPISQEQKRDLSILHGRGEDIMSRKQRERKHGQQNVDMPDDSSDCSSLSTATEAADWSTVGGLSPYDQVDYRSGVLGPDGNPDFSEARVWSYVDTFKESILTMHPIVQPRILDQWVREFLKSLPLQGNKHSSKASTAWAASSSMESTGSKRKRTSPASDSMETSSAASPTSRIGRPIRTIDTALVLTVLALGKVCQYQDYVPDTLHVGDPMLHGNGRFYPNGIPQPKGDVSRSQSSSLASPRDQDRSYHSRRSSLSGNTRPDLLKKKYENVPGLEYFAFATDILGNYLGSSNNMKNVYAGIFASLYQGQLGRPLESFSFIQQASHELQVIMRPSLEMLKSFKTTQELIRDTEYNQISLVFWTCLQLESELLAELRVPPSGLLSYENDIPYPNMSLLEGFPQPVLDSYLGQLYLQTHLNSIHRMFYAPEDPSKGAVGEIPFKNVDFVSVAVSGMQWVAPSFAFKENDPPASDILSARLRAKYWGCQVLTYRPFLSQILQHSFGNYHPTTGQPSSSGFRAEVEAPHIDPQARNVQDLNPHILALAQKAIKALVESTRAFHGLGDIRPVITSVFSTAHAQWGNLLVLSAAFKDPIMHEYVDEKLLHHLFQKTIAFLRQSATATSSLRTDMHILEGLQKDFWGPTSHGNSMEYPPNKV